MLFPKRRRPSVLQRATSRRPSLIIVYFCVAVVFCLSYTCFDDEAPVLGSTRSSSSGFPRKIWYKLGPSGLHDQVREWTDTCIQKNPDFEHEFLTDDSADRYVQRRFGAHRPDIVDVYLSLTVPIFKADLLRYLLLFAEGGHWVDLDVSCEDTPMRLWVPDEFRTRANLVVCHEFDVGWDDDIIRQFETWVLVAKPGSPHVMAVIDDILSSLRIRAEQAGVPLSGLTPAMAGDVVDVTGPRRWTRSVLKSLRATTGLDIPMSNISHIREPRLVGDVLILPGSAFSNTTNFFPEAEERYPVLAVHHYLGSWKNERGGEMP